MRIRLITLMRIRIFFEADADADPDPDPSFPIKTQTLKKVLKKAQITHILACHLQTVSGPESGSSYGSSLSL